MKGDGGRVDRGDLMDLVDRDPGGEVLRQKFLWGLVDLIDAGQALPETRNQKPKTVL